MKDLKHLKRFLEDIDNMSTSDDMNSKFVYMVIDQEMHSYEAILGVYEYIWTMALGLLVGYRGRIESMVLGYI